MPHARTTVIDHEALFRSIHEFRLIEAASLLHRFHGELVDDPLLQLASEAFLSSVESALASDAAVPDRGLLEKLFLLHTGGFLALPDATFERVIEHLVRWHAEEPSAALAYARFRPENALCREVLDRFGGPVRMRVDSADQNGGEIQAFRSDARDATRPLFRSAQEEAFFHAVRDVFPTHLAYPNVALAAVLDFEALRPGLSPKERRFFFQGLIDCVVFDPARTFRPRYFFELDSPLHDDTVRADRDGLKERILGAAGQSLIRIRCRKGDRTRTRFTNLIREATAALEL